MGLNPSRREARPEPHELATAARLVAAGHRVEFLVPSQVPGVKTPDVLINGQPWELKSPIGSGRHTILHQILRASKQCNRVVLDTARTALDDERIIAEARYRLARSVLVEIWVLTKDGRVVRLSRDKEKDG